MTNLIGKKFGMLTVIDKLLYRSKYNRELYICECDCGEIVERTAHSLTRRKNPSCGCYNRDRIKQYAIGRRKPDIVGQRFGKLVVLGKSSRTYGKNRLWWCQCDCGKQTESLRSDLERGRKKSCGCIKRGGRNPEDITNQKFGTLTAIKLTGGKRNNKPLWLMRCDCGNHREMSVSCLRNASNSYRLTCGSKKNHPDKYLEYPPTPCPLPQEVGVLAEKYLHLTGLRYQQVDSEVEDEKRDRLIRAAWIIVYRRQGGESISGLMEERLIKKHLRYCSIDVFWQRKLREHGGLLYNSSGNKKAIGDDMTDSTYLDYPVIETQGINILPSNPKPIKKLRFNRR